MTRTKQRYLGQLAVHQLKEVVLNSINQQITKELGKLIFDSDAEILAHLVIIPIKGKDFKRSVRCNIFLLFDAFQSKNVVENILEVLRDGAVSETACRLHIEQVESSILFYELVN